MLFDNLNNIDNKVFKSLVSVLGLKTTNSDELKRCYSNLVSTYLKLDNETSDTDFNFLENNIGIELNNIKIYATTNLNTLLASISKRRRSDVRSLLLNSSSPYFILLGLLICLYSIMYECNN